MGGNIVAADTPQSPLPQAVAYVPELSSATDRPDLSA
jgi:hypothetical protein